MESDLDRLELFNAIWKEAEAWRQLAHPCLVRLVGITSQPGKIQFVTELLLPSQPLHKFLHARHPSALTSALRLRLAIDIARGLEFMHSMRPPMLHRDVKTPNVLVRMLCSKI